MTAVEDYLEFFEDTGAIRIKGHRIGLEHVLEQYKAGKSPEEIARYFPSLSLEQIYAAILYYFANRDTVDAYLQRLDEITRELIAKSDANPSAASLRLRKLWREMQEEKRRANEVPAR